MIKVPLRPSGATISSCTLQPTASSCKCDALSSDASHKPFQPHGVLFMFMNAGKFFKFAPAGAGFHTVAAVERQSLHVPRHRFGECRPGHPLRRSPKIGVSVPGDRITSLPLSICNSSMVGSFFSMENDFHDLVMGLVAASVAMGSLKFWDELAKRNVFDKKVSRKLVHISIGLIFMLLWPSFTNGHMAPYIAALSPGINTLRMLAIGFGIIEDHAVVKSMTRDGDYRELLKGPFYYGMSISIATLCFWRTSPLGPTIIASLCAGDGFADLIGRKFGSLKLSYNRNKSYAGSLAMLIFGFLFSVGYQFYFSYFGFFEMSSRVVIATLVVSLVATVVESLPISSKLDDNLTVPFTSFLVGSFLF